MSERDTIPATCPRCGRPSGASGIGQDFHETCFKVGSRSCRIAAAGYRAGIDEIDDAYCDGVAAAYRRGIDEGVRLAKEHTRVALCRSNEPSSDFTATWNWTDVDKAADAAKGER